MAFLLDDILLAPAKAVHFIAKKVFDLAMEERKEGVRQELRELHQMLERGEISEEEFEEREEKLVGWLEEIEISKER